LRYFRLLSNAIVAGVLATAYVLTVFLQLNPSIPITEPARLAPFVTSIGPFYLVLLAGIAYALLLVRYTFARDLFSPAWVSVGVMTWLGAVAAGAGAALSWANLLIFAPVLDQPTLTAMTNGAIVLSAAVIAFALLGQARRWIGSDARVVWAPVWVLIAATSIALPLLVRGRAVPAVLEVRPIDASVEGVPAERAAKVHIIAIDAASLEFITAAATEGRLPNFGRVLDAGAVMHMATLRPTSPEAIWTAVATGKLPQKNGIRSAGLYRIAGSSEALQLLPEYCRANGLVRLGLLTPAPHTTASLRTRTLWGILGAQGVSAGIVDWPVTHPAAPVRGYLVSDAFQRLAASSSGDSPAVLPLDAQADVAQAIERTLSEPRPLLPAAVALEPRFEAPARTDRIYDRIAVALADMRPVVVTLTRYQSLDPIGHYFLRYAMPSAFGDVTEEERRIRGPVLEAHYGIIDAAIGQAIDSLGAGDLLLVVSGYSMEPLTLWQRLLERVAGDPDLSGTHENAPDGFLMAFGTPVARGRRTDRASLVDIVPTVLYFLGLPVGRDMDGYARTELFQSSFIEDRPITFIPTYDR
jgi:hypothetical protein